MMTAFLDGNGYGRIRIGSRMVRAHRIVMEHHHGPSDLDVLHSCDAPSCVEIAHLRYGSPSDNQIDCVERNRTNRQRLTVEDVLTIRAALKEGRTQKSLATEFSVSQPCISNIATGKRWGWLD